MKQVLQSYRSGELWLAEVPVSACGRSGALVRTRCSLVSAGTEKMLMSLAKKSLIGKAKARPDLVKQVLKRVKTEGLMPTMEKVFAKLDEPLALGYSAAGDVIEVGREAGGLQPGKRVAIAGAGYATHAEFNYVPRNLCTVIPDGVSYADASFATLGAIAMQGVRQTAPQLGERIVVIGLGLLGLLTVQILKANGCAVLGVDPDVEKVDLARSLGADAAVSVGSDTACEAFTGGHGADAVIITAATPSNEPIETAAGLSRHKGRVVAVGLVGMDVPRDAYYRKELELRLSMSYGPGRYDASYEEGGQDYPFPYVRFTEQRNMESFLYLVQQGRVTPAALVSHRFALDDALDAYLLLEGKLSKESALPHKYLGILLEYPESAPLERTLNAERVSRAVDNGGGSIGVGFIGAGGFAKAVLLPHLAKISGVSLTGVCTSTGKSAQQTASRFGFDFATTDTKEVLENEDTDAVFIATRHASHARLVCAALQAGKHVFVEKPLCLTPDELREVGSSLEGARASGHEPCLMVGFNRRFSPHMDALRVAFEGRGTPMAVNYRVSAGRVPVDSWIQDPADGGGRILGEVCHFIDFCSALIDSEPTGVTATSISSPRRDVVSEDTVSIAIQYADGSLASIQYFGEGSPEMPKERCEVFADGMGAVVDNFKTTDFFGGGKQLRGKQAKGFAEELSAFVRVCRDGGAWPIPWESLVQTHKVCFASLQSLQASSKVCLGTDGRL